MELRAYEKPSAPSFIHSDGKGGSSYGNCLRDPDPVSYTHLLPVAMPMMYSEVKEAVEEYEPRAEVVNVTFAADRNAPGRLIPTVEVNIINE